MKIKLNADAAIVKAVAGLRNHFGIQPASNLGIHPMKPSGLAVLK